MKKRILIILFFLQALFIQAQTLNLKNPIDRLLSEFKGIFPIAVLAIFILAAIYNIILAALGEKKWSSCLWNILLFVGVLVLVLAVYNYISGVRLS